VRSLANLNEFFVHHEDVRRANGLAERTLEHQLEIALWRNVRVGGRYLTRRLQHAGLVLEWEATGERVVARRGLPEARVTGTPGELLLYVFGRQRVARVAVSGPDAALSRLHHTHLGM
jgi:uncharacterized protein (TIGR03085 family)